MFTIKASWQAKTGCEPRDIYLADEAIKGHCFSWNWIDPKDSAAQPLSWHIICVSAAEASLVLGKVKEFLRERSVYAEIVSNPEIVMYSIIKSK